MRSSRGYALLTVVVVISVLLLAATAAIQLTRSELHFTARHVARQKAFYVADAGVQRALARLSEDAATASLTTGYAPSPIVESFGGGSYTATITQDPLYPTDTRRKRIQSSGWLDGEQAVVVAHAVVQPPLASSVCDSLLGSDTGWARLVSAVDVTLPFLAAGGNLFNGSIFSNTDVEIQTLAGGIVANPRVQGNGTVRAAANFRSTTLIGLLTNLNAQLLRGANYIATVDTHLLGNPLTGIHFSNGASKHGVQQAIPARVYPLHDFQRLRDTAQAVVGANDPPPFGTWDAASRTWRYDGLLDYALCPSNQTVTYFVEGNASLGGLLLARNSRCSVVAEGWLALRSVNLYTGSVPVGASVAVVADPDDVAGALTLAVNVAGATQTFHAQAIRDVVIGRQVLAVSPSLTLDTELTALTTAAAISAAPGLGMSPVGLGVTNRVYAYSRDASTWLKTSTLDALSAMQVNACGRTGATLAFTASIASSVTQYAPAPL